MEYDVECPQISIDFLHQIDSILQESAGSGSSELGYSSGEGRWHAQEEISRDCDAGILYTEGKDGFGQL